MPYISPEQIKELQKIDLLTYLQNYEPEILDVDKNAIYAR